MKELIFTIIGVLIDCMILLHFLSMKMIKSNKKLFVFCTYIVYFFINCIINLYDLHFIPRAILNVLSIFLIIKFLYEEDIFYAVKDAVTFILCLGICELLVIPIIFCISGTFDVNIFYNSNNPQLWIIPLGMARLLAIGVLKIYRILEKNNKQKPDFREIILMYSPLCLCYICFLFFAKINIDIDKFNKKELVLLLSACAGILLFLTLLHMFLFRNYISYHEKNKEIKLLKQKNQIQYDYYNKQLDAIENIKILYHDIKKHLLVAEKSSTDYIDKVNDKLYQYSKYIQADSQILNILLYDLEKNAKKIGVKVTLNIKINKSSLEFIDDTDICAIFGNLFDNAIEACQKCILNNYFKILIPIINKQDK